MNNKSTPRYIVIGVVLIWAIYALWPTLKYQSLTEQDKEDRREAGTLKNLETKVIRQGLDLKGGMYIVLEVDLPGLFTNLASNRDSKFNRAIEEVSANLKGSDQDFFALFNQAVADHNLRLPRYYHEFGASKEDILDRLKKEADDAINRVLEILQNRVDQFGVSEPTIQKQGNHRVIVELAGIKDPERARALLQSTALLEFYIVKDAELTNQILPRIDNIVKGTEGLDDLTSADTTATVDSSKVDKEKVVSEDKSISVSELFGEEEPAVKDTTQDTSSVTVDQRLFKERPFSSLLRNLRGSIGVPENNVYAVKKILNLPEVQSRLESDNGQFLFAHNPVNYTTQEGQELKIYPLYYLEMNPELSGGVIEDAKAQLGSSASQNSGQPIVLLNMNSEGSRQWARVTGANVGREVAIVLDKKVRMAPRIKEKISGGGTLIEGFANIQEAKDLAIVLRAGALPAPVKIIEERIVGPSLGADSIREGAWSVIIGLTIVVLFILVYYKWSGAIADFALFWNLILVLSILASLQATLTLPGIAGLILTVGMSIDANVIIFERIREEFDKGKTPRAAVDAGYSNALTTIIDANVTTLIASLVLYQFGTGPIRGFATVLFWGIVISMFTAIFVTRTIFNSFVNRKGVQGLSI